MLGILEETYLKRHTSFLLSYFKANPPPPLTGHHAQRPKVVEKLVQHGVLPSLAGASWPGKWNLYCNGRSEPIALTDHILPVLARTAQLPLVTIPAATAAGYISKHIQ